MPEVRGIDCAESMLVVESVTARRAWTSGMAGSPCRLVCTADVYTQQSIRTASTHTGQPAQVRALLVVVTLLFCSTTL